MNKVLKYGLIVLAILALGLFITFGIFIFTFDIFGETEKLVLNTNCDYKGLRQATIFEFGGNAATIPAIIVSIDLGCSEMIDDSKKKIVFSAEHTGGTSVQTEWISFDTLKICYSDGLEPVTIINKVTFPDSTLNLIIEYKKK